MADQKDVRATIRVPPDLHKKIAHYAIDAEISLPEAIQRAWDYFEKNNYGAIAAIDKKRGKA